MYLSYQDEQFSAARIALMLPHGSGEDGSLVSAFRLIDLALIDLDVNALPSRIQESLAHLRSLKDYSATVDSTGEGLYMARARTMTNDEKRSFAALTDELATYFKSTFY